jgi:hypothetical protein
MVISDNAHLHDRDVEDARLLAHLAKLAPWGMKIYYWWHL